MRRCVDGFALLAVLWLVTLVGATLTVGLATVRLGQVATHNRITLARGRWAAEACIAILQGRWGGGRAQDTATIELGRTVRCAWRIDDPGAGLNVNHASRAELLALQAALRIPRDSSSRFTDTLLALRGGRPLYDDAELSLLPGYDERIAAYVTVLGSGAVSALRAPRPVLRALPGITAEAAERILTRRHTSRPVPTLDDLGGDLSPPAREALYANYAYLVSALAFQAPQLVIRAEGWVGSAGDHPRATIELVVVPLPERLAVVRRVMLP